MSKCKRKPKPLTLMQILTEDGKRTKLTNSDKHKLAMHVFDLIEHITLGMEERSGYYTDLEHLDPVAVRLQLEKWFNRLP